MESIVIRDSTLREGLELPGGNIPLKEKLKIARLLESAGIPEIEIGMPYGIKSCLSLAESIKLNRLKIKTSALILSYRPTCKEEVKIAAKSNIDRVEILFPTSDILLNLRDYYKIRKQNIPELMRRIYGCAKKYLRNAGTGFVDATRTDTDFLIQLAKEAQDSGSDRIIIYDTVGVATPALIRKMVSAIKRHISLPVFVHCHNDFGLATANSLAGLEAGADGADVVVNGLGDRGGNAALEEVVLALEILYGVRTGIKLEKLAELSRLVEKTTGIRKCPVKPVVGDFTFLHSPVMHIRNAASGNYQGFEPFEPELVGSQRRYAFTLDVDYQDALEPFYKKIGLTPKNSQKISIVNELRKKSKPVGLSEKQVLEIIRKIARK